MNTQIKQSITTGRNWGPDSYKNLQKVFDSDPTFDGIVFDEVFRNPEYFSSEKDGLRAALLYLTPDEYMEAVENAKPGHDATQSKIDGIKDFVEAGNRIEPPCLAYGDRDEHTDDFRQEGYNRAWYAREIGRQTIPVFVRYRENDPNIPELLREYLGLEEKAAETKIPADQDVADEFITEAEKRLNSQLNIFGKSVSIYETDETYDDVDEDDILYGSAMYEAVIIDDKTEEALYETTTGRYCDLRSVIDEITATAEEYKSKALEKWCEGSRVVDVTGEPLMVHHGTLSEFEEFNTSRGEHSQFGRGAYFTSSKRDAERYASKDVSKNPDIPAKAEALEKELEISYKEARACVTEGEGRVIHAYLNMTNPIEIGGSTIKATVKEIEGAMRLSDVERWEYKARVFVALDELARRSSEPGSREFAEALYEITGKYDLNSTRIRHMLERTKYDPAKLQLQLLTNMGVRELMITQNADGIIYHNVDNVFSWMEPGSKHYFVRKAEQILIVEKEIVIDETERTAGVEALVTEAADQMNHSELANEINALGSPEAGLDYS